MSAAPPLGYSVEQWEEIKQLIRSVDKNGDGTIQPAEFKQMLEEVSGENFDLQAVEKVLAQADINGDGKVNYEELFTMFHALWEEDAKTSAADDTDSANQEEVSAENVSGAELTEAELAELHLVSNRDATGRDAAASAYVKLVEEFQEENGGSFARSPVYLGKCMLGETRADRIKELLSQGASISVKEAETGASVLEVAVRGGFAVEEGVVSALIEAKADVNGDSTSFVSPMLHTAIGATWKSVRTNVALMLVEAKADVSLKNNAGSAPLHLAAKAGHPGLVSALLAAKADPLSADSAGETALQIATRVFGASKSLSGKDMKHAVARWGQLVQLLAVPAEKVKPKKKAVK